MRKKRWENRLAQFGYDHENLHIQFTKIQKSAGEISRMLENLPLKNKKNPMLKNKMKKNEKTVKKI